VFRTGLGVQCQINGENLECLLILPNKFRTHIEGLAGNFNGKPDDDLVNRQTNQTVSILFGDDRTSIANDLNILRACLSCK
jgi:hypothetical protein